MHISSRFPRHIGYMFWAGVMIGLTWELGFYFTGPEFSNDPVFTHLSPWPLHPILQPLLHTLWDGGLFMIGVSLVYRFCKPPHFIRFRWQELGIMLLWGQIQELAVELIATSGNLWTYEPKWWNPVLFKFGNGVITLIPQAVWFAAPIVFYLASIIITSNERK
ncbi:MAG: hypothetical protein JRI53_08675 [Deltaproteobacteria bacterium]|nr:hypothetical protein [Deltaproteobacteria bacterium]